MLYRGCMFSFLFALVAAFSLLLSTGLGWFGLLAPWALIGFAYLLVDTILVELMWWDRNRNS